MNTQTNERIKIAKNFKSIYNWEGKSPEKREKTLKRDGFLDYGLAMLLLSVLTVASAMNMLRIDPFINYWANAGLLVLFAMTTSLRSPFLYIELLLHKHISKIRNSEIEFDEDLNIEFSNIITRFNKRVKNIYVTGIPLILIALAGFIQVLFENPYWDKFPPLILVLSLYLIFQINYDVFRLKKILRKVAI